METFNRVTLEVPAAEEITIDPLQQELAVKAKRLLGYGLLEDHLQGGVVTQARERAELTTLAQTLGELDIQPLDTQEVESYQRKEQKKLNRKSFFALPRYAQLCVLLNKMLDKMFSPFEKHLEWLACILLICIAIGGVSGIVFLCVGQWLTAEILSPLTFLTLCMAYAISLTDRVEKLTLQKWGWTKLTFADCYERKVEIPPFALDTAVRVKEKMPDADLFVEAATSTDLSLGDPFLCLRHGGITYYLEVWEESSFERELRRRA
jgi:hypothetical protein